MMTRPHVPARRSFPALALALALATFAVPVAKAGPAEPVVVAQAQPQPGAPQGRTLKVGPGQAYAKPSDAARAARDGDRIQVSAGSYVDCAVWKANNLVIEAPAGPARVRDKACNGKGIFVIQGDNILVRNLILSGARVPDKNGAGIRAEGINLTVENTQFLNNENGILAQGIKESTIVIRGSRFEDNGKCDPICAHGIYINRVGRLRVENSTFRRQHVGHHIKSRAHITEVVGTTIEDGTDGNASYLIDIPNGGQVLIENNQMQKGARSENVDVAISIGAEGATNPAGSGIRVVNNRFRSDLPGKVAFVRNSTPSAAALSKNKLTGNVTPLVGRGNVTP